MLAATDPLPPAFAVAMLDGCPDAVLLVALDGRIREANPAATRFYGHPREELLTLTIADLRSTDSLAELPLQLGAAEQRGLRFETVHRRKDGSTVPVEVSSQGVTVGETRFLVSVVRDMSERLRQRRELEASEERYRLLFEGALEGIYRTTLDGKNLAANPALARMLGYASPDEVTFAVTDSGHQVWVDPAERQRFVELLTRHGVVLAHECRLRRKDGAVLWVSLSSRLVRDAEGNPLHTEGFVEDVTERVTTQDALRESEERYRSLVEKSLDGIGLSRGNRTLFANRALLDMVGDETVEQFQSVPLLDRVAPESRRLVEEHVARRLAGDESPAHFEYKLVRRDGSTLDLEVSTSTVTVCGERCTQAVFRDITHRKVAEERRAKLEAELRQAQKMEAVGRLAGGVAHDFNNILSVILGCTDLALESLREGDPLRDDLLEVAKAGNRAASLTRQLLAFSRKQLMQPVVLQLNAVIADLAKMLHRLIGEDIELELALAPDLSLVRADPGQIEQVIVNLAVNSRDAMPGGGRLTIETANVELGERDVALHPGALAGPHVRLAVHDTGCGMDEATVRRVFEPFFTTKEPGRGTGLGLSTVYGIVHQSGGVVGVRSTPGAGTTFEVYLPQDFSAAAAAARDSLRAPQLGGSETILIVEDDEDVRRLARRILGDAGYRVLTAASGTDALATCERSAADIHLVLTDVVMPEMSGRVFVERLLARRGGMKVLYMSGYVDDAIVHHGVLSAGTNFLSKPLARIDLLRKVRDVLDA